MATLVRYDVRKLEDDMATRGWLPRDLARAAQLSDSTVSRFLRGEFQTARTCGKLASALGFTARRYVVRRTEAA
jgi:hypothetical protein